MERMVQLGRVSRASFYRFDENAHPGHDADMDLRDAIQRIALEWPSYGRPRITAELRASWMEGESQARVSDSARGQSAVHAEAEVRRNDRFQSRPQGLSEPGAHMVLTGVGSALGGRHHVHPAARGVPLFGRHPGRFSRRVIGWALGRTLEDKLTLAALHMALSRRSVQPGLVHHSDRGSQYASGDYTDLLKDNGIGVSMSRKGNPWDNAACESFMKTLKYEEVFRSEYRDLPEARLSIREFLEKVYNEKRLHSALGYVPPTEFEESRSTTRGRYAAASSMSFQGIGKSIHPMRRRQPGGQRPRSSSG